MTTFNTDLQDLRFVIEEQFRFDEIIAAQPDMDFSMDDLSMILGETQRFCREVLHPLQEVCESDPPRLEDGRVRLPKSFHDVYNTYYRDGWGSMSVDPKFGGQGLPQTIGLMSFEMIIAACPSFSFIPGLARAAARVIESVGSPEQVDTYCAKMFAGTWGGTMCLTEPHAGSALDKLHTIATRQEDGSYRIVGNKCFISAGDQDLTENFIHLVLARTPDAPKGTRGLSLFVVPSVREDQSPNDVTVTALEEKMGLHGSPTCGLAFGDQGDCTGFILGGEGEGLRHMFLMMLLFKM